MAGEKNFENRIKDFLKEQECWFIKYWAGAAFTKTGIPDLLINCNGHFVAVEVKAKNGVPSELQKYNVKNINDGGGFALILYPNQFDDFKRMVDHLQNNCTSMARVIVDKVNERWNL